MELELKKVAIVLIALFGSIYVGCRQGGSEAPAIPRNEAGVWINNTRTLADGSVIVRTEQGTIIKKDGWRLPIELPAATKYHATTVVIDGRQVTVLNSPFLPAEKLLASFP